MDLKQLSYFMLIFEEGSFSKAAAKAGVVQPALSSQVKKLETEFGTTLFVRTHRGVEPTAAGKILYDLATTITGDIADVRQKLSRLIEARHVSGTLRVGLPPSLSRGIFSPVITRFMADYPNVEPSMMEAFSGTLTEWVRDGRVDLAIGAVPVDVAGLRQRKLYRDPVVLISGKPIAGPQFTPCHLNRIPNLKLVLPSSGNSFGEAVRQFIAKGDIVAQSILQVDGTSGGMELTRLTDWAGVCPFVAVQEQASREAFYIYPIASPVLNWDLFLLYDHKRPLSPAASSFVEILEQELRRVRKVWDTLIAPNLDQTAGDADASEASAMYPIE